MKFKQRRVEDFTPFYHTEHTPHYHLVPKDLQKNIAYRRKVLKLASKSKSAQEQFRKMCSEDLLFYINTFCYTLSPKDYQDAPDRPFVTYAYQDEVLLRSIPCIGEKDIVVPKSRDMGVTWIYMCLLEWLWHFRQRQQILIVSWKADIVDTRDDPGTLFGKIDYLHDFMPKWLLPTNRALGSNDPGRMVMQLKNADNGSLVVGESTVPDLGRAKRFTVIFLDEQASLPNAQEISRATQSATDCRIGVSTPKGTGGMGEEFYQWTLNKDIREVIEVHWRSHPEKSVGLYEYDLDKEKLRVWDKDYHFPESYEFIKDGKIRSPWYDRECERAVSEKDIEQELDISFLGSGSSFFKPDRIAKLKKNCYVPQFLGDLSCDDALYDIAFCQSDHGHLKIWNKPVPGNVYVIGADVATGSGGDTSSNSALSVFNTNTTWKDAEYACHTIAPAQFATMAVALCKYYNGAHLIWEINGPGASFGRKVVQELFYAYVYYRRNLDSILNKESQLPGFFSNKNTKRIILSEYADAIYREKYLNPSEAALDECLQYSVQPDNTIEHERSRTRTNEHAAGPNHGDRVIADALSWHLGKDITEHVEPNDITDLESDPPVGSFAWRRKTRMDRQRELLHKDKWR